MAKKKTPTNANISKQNISVGLDVGTSKVCALVAAPGGQPQKLNILGIGIADSDGINRGVVVNIDKTVRTIQKVIEQAEQQSGCEIKEVVVGIAGDHIESSQSRGIIGISNPTREIRKQDVDRIIDECRNVQIPSERQILHIIPQEFIIDGQDGITDPVGMSGVRLEANVHVVTGLQTAIQNLHKCIERNNISVKAVVLEPLASSYAVLEPDEKEVGVCLIDIGGGTTDIAIFEENVIRFTSVFGIAGKQVTDDIRRGLGIVANHAERLKREYGHSYIKSIYKDDLFMVPGVGGRKPLEISKSEFARIIQPRMEEIFEIALSEIRRSGYAGSLGAGVVITGGTALLRGTEDLATEIFGMPVKIGIPSGLTYSGLAPEVENPVYSTSVGLALYGLKDKKTQSVIENVKEEKKEEKDKISIFKRVQGFMKEL
jgi:cell division protein FtsA